MWLVVSARHTSINTGERKHFQWWKFMSVFNQFQTENTSLTSLYSKCYTCICWTSRVWLYIHGWHSVDAIPIYTRNPTPLYACLHPQHFDWQCTRELVTVIQQSPPPLWLHTARPGQYQFSLNIIYQSLGYWAVYVFIDKSDKMISTRDKRLQDKLVHEEININFVRSLKVSNLNWVRLIYHISA